jgi:2-oxoglutarate ferredoxin oxidoreductase subunit delta
MSTDMETNEMKYWRKPLDADKIEIPRGDIHIIDDQCKGCGFCVEYCPKDILELSAEFNTKGYHPPIVLNENDCVYCQLCEIICPEFAIYVTSTNGLVDDKFTKDE